MRRKISRGLRQRPRFEISPIGRPPVKARVRSLPIVEFQVTTYRLSALRDAVVGYEIDILILDRAPETFDECNISPETTIVHADLDPIYKHEPYEFIAGEPTPLVCI